MSQLGIYKLHQEVQLPEYGSEDAACFDIRAFFKHKESIASYDTQNFKQEYFLTGNGKYTLAPGERALVPTGIVFAIPEGYSLRLHPRSGLSLKSGLTLGNCQGIIDSDYYHETFVMLMNTSLRDVEISHGDRVCQGELVRTDQIEIREITAAPEQTTDRSGGFGSTGTK